MEKVELKVEMVGIHEKRVRKCLSKLKGIEKVEVDSKRDKVVVTVNKNVHVHQQQHNKIVKAVRRVGLKADFWSPHHDLLHAYATTSAPFSFAFHSFHFQF
ncbi:hypothetical protein L6164_024966 [Bauhinia variegata]|uniref:Uncharacterized protein n=1 Tax=Bauhinia variegata TaxID=167791 RepID=A0ACB9M007_BAUVA|nr:hypothetical protein L6164_024966 [Bauhinia variegata]